MAGHLAVACRQTEHKLHAFVINQDETSTQGDTINMKGQSAFATFSFPRARCSTPNSGHLNSDPRGLCTSSRPGTPSEWSTGSKSKSHNGQQEGELPPAKERKYNNNDHERHQAMERDIREPRTSSLMKDSVRATQISSIGSKLGQLQER